MTKTAARKAAPEETDAAPPGWHELGDRLVEVRELELRTTVRIGKARSGEVLQVNDKAPIGIIAIRHVPGIGAIVLYQRPGMEAPGSVFIPEANITSTEPVVLGDLTTAIASLARAGDAEEGVQAGAQAGGHLCAAIEELTALIERLPAQLAEAVAGAKPAKSKPESKPAKQE